MSLRARLLAGLLAVGVLLLIALSTVSVFVLHGHLLQRLDDQLAAATSLTAKRIAAAPGGRLSQMLTGSTYAVTTVNAISGEARLIGGDAPGAAAVPELVERFGRDRLLRRAADGQTFDLTPADGDRLMARVVAQDLRPNRLVVVAVPLDSVEAPVRRLIVAELVTGGVLIVVLALGGRLLITGGLAPLGRMAGTAHRMAAGGDLSARMPEGSSEVGRLGAAVNLLLERISVAFRDRWASEDRVRRFAADASHELRTPLSTIRGYAELYRTGALADGDLPKIMGRIEDEATRMSDLVAQLLELARLDRGAELQLAATDLAEVAREVGADCAALDPERTVTVSAPGSLVAVVDEARVRQILVNLLANVRAHTPPGTTATLALVETGRGGVLIEVSDDGRGMSDPARAFDRFHKGTQPEGTGLGLSIVKAITEAHGGRCWITSAAGHGTAVHVELPLPAA